MMWYSAGPDGVTIDVLVQPRSSQARIGAVAGDRLKLYVTAPPVDGAANAAVTDLVARTWDLRRAAVEIVAGHSGRRKTLRLLGLGVEQLLRKVKA